MFRCEHCGQVSQPKERLFRIPQSFRQKTYIISPTKTTYGYEIEKEIEVCEACAKIIKISPPPKQYMSIKRKKETVFEILTKEPIKIRRLHDTQYKKVHVKNKNRSKPKEDKWKDVKIDLRSLRRESSKFLGAHDG